MIKKIFDQIFFALMVFGAVVVDAWANNSLFPFDETENVVALAPKEASSLTVPKESKVIAVALSPLGGKAVIVIEDKGGRQSLLSWRIGEAEPEYILKLAETLVLNSLTWHPKGTALFAAGGKDLYRLDEKTGHAQVLWTSQYALSHLIAGPRPFDPGYRLFFAQKGKDGKRQVGSVTEKGQAFYDVTAVRKAAATADDGEDVAPNTEIMPDALPVAFHPAGNRLLLANDKGCFVSKDYELDNWGNAYPLEAALCGKTLSYTPNGISRLIWAPGKAGVMDERRGITLAADHTFTLPPAITADGRGIVGVVQDGKEGRVLYLPQDFPLADVTNAWMFLEGDHDQRLLSEEGGLFRALDYDQLYQLYDSESYYCGGFDVRQPTRPYFVTTDIFWEVYAAAFQGLFMTVERERAMPAFRALVTQAAVELAATHPESTMRGVFDAVQAVLDGNPHQNAEAARIMAAQGMVYSDVLRTDVDYAAYKVRGSYSREKNAAAYFQAMRYLGHLRLKEDDVLVLNTLSEKVRGSALEWIGAYRPFIEPSRATLVWDKEAAKADHLSRAHSDILTFPLSWGWDNEIFDSTIHHPDRPMEGPGGVRTLPTGLDIAAALGNPLADSVLAEIGQFRDFPNLQGRIAELGRRFAAEKKDDETLYARWIRALATQWMAQPQGPIAGRLWNAKRLQTGLASWATLRHTTILVNDMAVAECGEAGFESIIMSPPRGYVEPDPATFTTIAALFRHTAALVHTLWPSGDPLARGISDRLMETAGEADFFGGIAAKEIRGDALTAEEYAKIHYVGRSAEHNFLVFYGLTVAGEALTTPDPMPKIADVAGGPATGFLNAAVGRPLEWNQIVPSFGRRVVVKGAVYSYYEFPTMQPVSDEEWRARVSTEPRPGWVAPFLSEKNLSCPPRQ